MKKLVTILALFTCISIGAHAQHCAAAFTSAPFSAGPPNTPGLSPTSANLPCIDSGATISDTITFENYQQAGTFTIDSLIVDSINNLPAGLCWVMNKASNEYAGGESGIIIVSGTCNAAPGQYKLDIWVNIDVNGTWTGNANAEVLTGTLLGPSSALRYYVRVKDPGLCCYGLDTTNGKTSFYVTDSVSHSSTNCTVTLGMNESTNDFTNVTVMPNPFSSSSLVNFSSSVEGNYTMRMTDLTGRIVSSKEISVIRGGNQITVERNGLSTGMYLLSLSNQSGTVTRKVVIE